MSDQTPHYDATKPCCSICDSRKKCHICGAQTLLACSDCQIDLSATVYVCSQPSCRDAHESKHPTTLTARCEALEQENLEIEAAREVMRLNAEFQQWAQGYLDPGRWAGHDRSDAVKTELLERDVRCEALTAERDEFRRDFDAELAGNAALRTRYGARDDETMFTFMDRLADEASRCQHLEQAVKDITAKWRGMSGLGDESDECTELVLKYCARDLVAALASLLPAQEETPGTDENRVSFAAGYTAALDDALKGKP